MFPLLNCCVAAAVPRLGRFLASFVPGGGALAEVVEFGADVWERWKKQKPAEADRREELKGLAHASAERVEAAVQAAIQAEAAGQPDAVKRKLTTYLIQVQVTVRRTLRQPATPEGRTVPAKLRLNSAEDLLPFLPPQLPRFEPGELNSARRRGVPGWVWLAGGAAAVVVAVVVVLVVRNGSGPETPAGPPVAAKGPGADDRPKDANKTKDAADLAKKAEEDKLRAKDLLEKADEKEKKALHKEIEDTVKGAVANLKDKNPAIRIKAANALAKLPSIPATKVAAEPLVEAMMDPVQEVRIAASEALAKIAPAIQPHVLTLLIGNDKYAAARELPGLGKEAKFALPALIHCYQTNASTDASTTAQNSNTRGVWLDSLAGIAPDDKRVVQIVLDEVAKDKYGSNVRGGVFYMARLKAISLLDVVQADKKEKVKALVPVLDANSYPQMTTAAIIAIERIGAPEAAEAIPALKKLKLSPDDAVRQEAASAVAKIESSK